MSDRHQVNDAMDPRSHEGDQGTAQVVEAWLREGVSALPDGDALPDDVMDRVVADVDRIPQRSGWRRLPFWRGPDRLMMSAAAVAAVIAVLLLSFAFVLPLTSDTLEDLASVGDDDTIRVAADGSGDYTTIGEAVSAAGDGDTVLVGPGTYIEAIVIDQDITLRGDGDREAVVITAPQDGPRARVALDGVEAVTSPYAVLIDGASATLENLTFRGRDSVVHVTGGAPSLSGLLFDGVNAPYDTSVNLIMRGSEQLGHAIVINGGSSAHVSTNTVTNGGAIGIYDGSGPTVADNELIDSHGISGHPGDGGIISGNDLRGGTIHIYGPTTAVVEANRISDADSAAIRIGLAQSPGTDPIIRDNRISGSETGITVQSGARPTIEDNQFFGNGTGVLMSSQQPMPIHGNDFRDNASGIFLMAGAPVIEDNTITGGSVGLGLGSEDAVPVLHGNTICDNETNVNLIFGAEMPDVAGNSICTTYRVIRDGSGDFTTIGEAVAAARDGDTVLVGPGTYTEAVAIERDITLQGDGDREDVVIVAPEGGPEAVVSMDAEVAETDSYAILLRGTSATVEGFTLSGRHSVLSINGGAPTIRGLSFESVGSAYKAHSRFDPPTANAIVINGESRATVLDNRIEGGGAIVIWDDAAPTLSGNELIESGGIHIHNGDAGATIRGNILRASPLSIWAVNATVEDNLITDVPALAVQIGGEALLHGNEIRASGTAISVNNFGVARIEDNELVGNDSAIEISDSDDQIAGNELRDNASGIFVLKGAPVITDNTITGGTVGLGLGSGDALPVLAGNTICDNESNVNLMFDAKMPDTTGNTVCGSTLRVAQDGSGDFATITEAVAVAQDGDAVLVGPGTYTEAVLIERDIKLRGDGDRADIVITAPRDGPRAKLALGPGFTDTAAYAVLLRYSDATLDNLTFRGEDSVVHATGGAPVLSSLRFEDVEGRLENDAFYGSGAYLSAVIINGGSAATVEDNLIAGPGGIGVWDRSNALVVGNELIGTEVAIRGEPGDEAVIRGNDIRGGREAGILLSSGATSALIEANTIRDVGASAIQIGGGETSWLGIDPIISDNTISGSGSAITVGSGASPTVVGNVITGNTLAIVVTDSDLSITGNELRDNASGIFIMSGEPSIEGNSITGGTVGLGLGGERASPRLGGNTICDNATNVNLSPGAAMPDTTGNEICADGRDLASQ